GDASDRAADLLENRQRRGRGSGGIHFEQRVDGRVRNLSQELRLPVVALAPGKDAVSGRLRLNIGDRSDPVLNRRAVCPERLEYLLANVERTAVADGDAEDPLARRC